METKDFIIAQCLKLFLQKSYKDVTMKEIVEKTKLSKGAFYHYFRSKEQLFLEVMDRFFTRAVVYDFERYSKKSLYQFFQDHLADLKESLNQFNKERELGNLTTTLDTNYLYPIFDAMRMFPDYEAKLNRSRQAEIKAWSSAVERARTSGEIRTAMSNDQIARLFIFSGNGTGLFAIMTNLAAGDMVAEYRNLWEGIYQIIKY